MHTVGIETNSTALPAVGCGEGREQRGLRHLFPGGQPRELVLNEIEVVADRVKIGARLISLSQCQRVFVWHAHVMPEQRYSILKAQTSPDPCMRILRCLRVRAVQAVVVQATGRERNGSATSSALRLSEPLRYEVAAGLFHLI